jgi:hypothetical protein
MSHLESGFAVKNPAILKRVVELTCPDLEMVQQKAYRTWVTGRGSLVGDYPLPSIYQLILVRETNKALQATGQNIWQAASAVGVTLPADLTTLEETPWNLEQQNALLKIPELANEYRKLNQETISKDADWVIRHKTSRSMYEIGLVPHPLRKNEWSMMTDFYAQGGGLLNCTGVGQHRRHEGKDVWGGTLKQAYGVAVAEHAIATEMAKKNPEYNSVSKTVLADGTIRLEVV